MEVDNPEDLPKECRDLTPKQLRIAKIALSNSLPGTLLANACIHAKNPGLLTKTGLQKRPRQDGGKTRRVRKNKKRQQKKSRRNYK
jgi:hypothetical protein